MKNANIKSSIDHKSRINLKAIQLLALIALCLLSGHSSTADTIIPEEITPELTLRVKPSLCLTYAVGEECELTVEVIWTNSFPGSYCLHSIQDSSPVQCWENLTGGSVEEQRTIREDLIYWLSLPGQDEQLVAAKVEMANIVEDEKRHRSRRHIWNLI